jgi:plasmid stabilization system protein ParE
VTYRVRILRRAQHDLVELDRYLEIEAPNRREDALEAILGAIERLGRLPRSGPAARDERLGALGFRYLTVGDQLVFYKIAAREVRVYRVLHQRRAYWRLLR